MPSVMDLLVAKGAAEHTVYSISPNTMVLDAVHQMNKHKVGALVVMEDDRLVGMFTERDVLRRVLAEGQNPNLLKVADAMTRDVICCAPDTDVEEASRLMKDHRVRHLPICDRSGNLLGLVSIGDLNAFYVSAQEMHIMQLTDYIYGRV